jgi:AbrB family looped-hinge helix DNA binding protein
MRVNRDKKNRTYIYLPAFLRDKFDLQNGDKVEVDTDGANIILKPKKIDEEMCFEESSQTSSRIVTLFFIS